MATTGIKYPVFSPITAFVEDDVPTYGTGIILGKATKVDASLNYAEGSFYADNALAEYDAKLQGGTITLGVDELTPAKRHALFGHFTSTADNVTTLYACADDKVVHGGFGYYKTIQVDGQKKYSARWYYHAVFKESTESAETANDSITFSGTEIVATILPVYDADVGDAIYEERVVTTETAAKEYLNELANVPANAPLRSVRPQGATTEPATGGDTTGDTNTGTDPNTRSAGTTSGTTGTGSEPKTESKSEPAAGDDTTSGSTTGTGSNTRSTGSASGTQTVQQNK